MTSFDFLKGVNPSFRRKIDGCYANVAIIMEEYKVHIKETSVDEQNSPEEFLKKDFLLERMTKDFDCYDDVLWAMKEWAIT